MFPHSPYHLLCLNRRRMQAGKCGLIKKCCGFAVVQQGVAATAHASDEHRFSPTLAGLSGCFRSEGKSSSAWAAPTQGAVHVWLYRIRRRARPARGQGSVAEQALPQAGPRPGGSRRARLNSRGGAPSRARCWRGFEGGTSTCSGRSTSTTSIAAIPRSTACLRRCGRARRAIALARPQARGRSPCIRDARCRCRSTRAGRDIAD